VARAAGGGGVAKGRLRSEDGVVGEKRCDKANYRSSCVSCEMWVASRQRRVWPQFRMLQRQFVRQWRRINFELTRC